MSINLSGYEHERRDIPLVKITPLLQAQEHSQKSTRRLASLVSKYNVARAWG
jgi:hypothetical protein